MKILLPFLLLLLIITTYVYAEEDFPPYIALDLPDRYVILFSNADIVGKSLDVNFSMSRGSKYPISCEVCYVTSKTEKEGVTQTGDKVVTRHKSGPIRMLILTSPTDTKNTWHLVIGRDTVIGIPKIEPYIMQPIFAK